MVDFLAQANALLGSDAVAHVWTSNRDGTPQVSVVWVIARGDEILFGTSADSQKARNLARDSRIVLSIEDTERNERGYQRHLLIRGTASIDPGPDPVLMDELAMKYLGLAASSVGGARLADERGGAGGHRSDQRRRTLGRALTPPATDGAQRPVRERYQSTRSTRDDSPSFV